MKLGIEEGVFQRFGEERFRLMKELGFDYADLFLNGELAGRTEEEYIQWAKEVNALAAKDGITVHQVHGPWVYPPHDETEERRAERMECMRLSLRATAAIGCKYWVIHPVMPFGTKEEPDYDRFWQINLEFFRTLLPYAKERGIIICLENMPMTHLTVSPPAETLRLIREIHDENFQMCLDTGHSFIKGVEPADAVRMAGEELRVLHVHDNCGFRDEHRFPFMGKIQWREFYKALTESGFDGVFSLEIDLSKDLSVETSRALLGTLPALIGEVMRKD